MASSPSPSAKSLLRKEIRARIGQMMANSEGREQIVEESAIVRQKLLNHSWLLDAKRLSIYVSMEAEIGTHEIIRWALREGKQVFIPRFKKGREPMEMLKLESEAQFEGGLDTTIWGIRQHPQNGQHKPPQSYLDGLESGQNALDLILMPGLAFTPDGKRLGHGRGHYDRFLAEYAERSGEGGHLPRTIGLALLCQLVDQMPVVAGWDKKVDLVIHA